MRLDQYMVARYGLTRNKAQQLILSGLVFVDAKICNKASYAVGENAEVSIVSDRRVEWVSRSAEKLAGFLENLPIPLRISGCNCLDVGASTGGFTQVLLSHGAEHIDAVDVGTDQLHARLRESSRVTSYEKTDIRDFSKEKACAYDIIVCDASFISLLEIIDAILYLADTNTKIILLYKPQFEVGRMHLRKTGVPKDPKWVDQKMQGFEGVLSEKNVSIVFREKSTLMGEAGNQEWIYLIQKNTPTF